MTITVTANGKSQIVAIRPDTAEYLLTCEVVDPKDWRVKDLILSCWAAARQVK